MRRLSVHLGDLSLDDSDKLSALDLKRCQVEI
jgi:hypothetical protein